MNIGYIEVETGYDILNISETEIDVIDTHSSDTVVITIPIFGKTDDEIVELIDNC